MAKSDNTLLIVGGLVVAGYFLFFNNSAGPVTNPLTTLQNAGTSLLNTVVAPTTTYPYLVTGAPGIPAAYSAPYYLVYIRPAMLALNSNINNPAYTLSNTDINNYFANYTDVKQWAYNTGPTGGGRAMTPQQAAIYHWHTYGVPDQRTFLPLPWNDPVNWVPPPANAKSSSSSSWIGTALQVAGTVASAVIMAGPATSDSNLNDGEINLVITSAAITKKILPFYLEVAPKLVASIENTIDILISEYAD